MPLADGRSLPSVDLTASAQVAEELNSTSPEVPVWFRSASGVFFQGAQLFAYVFCETMGSLLSSFALKPDPPPKFKPLPGSIVVVASGLSIVLGLLITTGNAIVSEKIPLSSALPKTLSAVFHRRDILSYSLVSVIFSLAKIFKKMAFTKMDAGLVEVLDQSRLPLTAALGTVILGKKYCMQEWLILLVMFLAICSFYSADVQHNEVTEMRTRCRYPPSCFDLPSYDLCALRVDGPTIFGIAIKDEFNVNGTQHTITSFPLKADVMDCTGFIFSLTASFCVCVGSLFAERWLKSTSSTPFSIQKVQMETTAFPFAICMSFIVPMCIDRNDGKAIWWTTNEADGSGAGFFQGYNQLTAVTIAMDIVISWMGGIIVKHFSALARSLAKCSAMLLTVFFGGAFFKVCQADPLPFTMYSLAFVVAVAAALLATIPK